MAFDADIRDAIYYSPSGVSFVLQFNALDRSGGKKAAVHEFPQQNEPDIQDLGNSAERYPMAVYFTGENAQKNGDALWNALSEKGNGVLSHPRWGDIEVLPVSWAQTEDKVEGLGRVSFSIDFIKVALREPFPITTISIIEAVSAINDVTITSAQNVSVETIALESAKDKRIISKEITRQIENSKSIFLKIIEVTEEIKSEFERLYKNILSKADFLVGDAFIMFSTLREFVYVCQKASGKTIAKISSYREWAQMVIAFPATTYAQAVFLAQSLYVALSGIIDASTTGEIKTRNEAVQIANELENSAKLIFNAIENLEKNVLEFHANFDALNSLKDSLGKAKISVLDRVFSLKAEQKITLATSRTPLDLIAEFYGDEIKNLDETLDEFIELNELISDEIILIPAGREVIYYG